MENDPQKASVRGPLQDLFSDYGPEQTQCACRLAGGIFGSSVIITLTNLYHQDPSSIEGRNIARNMTSTSMMILIPLLENILASKEATEKKLKDQKETSEKVGVTVHPLDKMC